METGNGAEALAAYRAWQRRHPEIQHVVQPNIQRLRAALAGEAPTDPWLDLLIQWEQEARRILHQAAATPAGQPPILVCLADLLASLCSVHVGFLWGIDQAGLNGQTFQDSLYLELNPDVKEAVALGHFRNGHDHFCQWGRDQDRPHTFDDFYRWVVADLSLLAHGCLALAEQPPNQRQQFSAVLQRTRGTFGSLASQARSLQGLVNSLSSEPSKVVGTSIEPASAPASRVDFHQDLKRIQEKLDSCAQRCEQVLSGWSTSTPAARGLIRPVFLTEEDHGQAVYDLDFSDFSLAVHIHVFYLDLLSETLHHLKAIPFPYDLFLTYSAPHIQPSELLRILSAHPWVPTTDQLIPVSNRGRNLAPLVTVLAEPLLKYRYIAHLHTKKSEHTPELEHWRGQILGSLFRGKDAIRRIIHLLQDSVDLVMPPPQTYYLTDPTGWGDNQRQALAVLQAAQIPFPLDPAVVRFPEGGMFWMSGRLMQRLAALNLRVEAFEEEPIAQDGAMAHAMERLVGVLACAAGKKIGQVFIESPPSTDPSYEDQQDYSQDLAGLTARERVRVLALFLPQFHETYENNTWHGEGFTDWTNVRRSQPLFSNHDQQRFPHPDLGYYDVAESGYFERTAKWMQASGVDGLIFYHYWFHGTTILAQPAQLLLAHPELALPWCFCWANENWTRAWDGNEEQVLMRQTYSRSDARAFIEYLIPYLKDERYLKIGTRPLLIVYRPSHNPLMKEYVQIWKQACLAAGLAPPYCVATLTRGTVNPDGDGFDAGLERVLHDWTGGAVQEINGQLDFHAPFGGRVLDYNAVAEHYMRRQPSEPFKLIRSLVPSWDNSPRYGNQADLVHQSSPRTFSAWLRNLILDARGRLEEEERMVVVNAWNEWAESAYLEPDGKHGFAYLNSVARAKLGLPYDMTLRELERCLTVAPRAGRCWVEIPPHVARHLQLDEGVRRTFWSCLAGATEGQPWVDRQTWAGIPEALKGEFLVRDEEGASCLEPGLVRCVFRRIEYLSPGSLDGMVRQALAFPGQIIAANSVQFSEDPIACWQAYAIDRGDCHGKLGVLATTAPQFTAQLQAKLCPTAWAIPSSYGFLNPGPAWDAAMQVTTILRIHPRGNLRFLQRALLSLLVMEGGVEVRPVIAAQDFHEPHLAAELRQVVHSLPWATGCEPVVLEYRSSMEEPDCRARMLVEPLRQLATRYVAYLDHDDYLYPFAYSSLLQRLQSTSKAVSFGRVYVACTDLERQLVVEKRREFEEGFSYEQFLRLNHAPLHSFLLDASQLNLAGLRFIPGMKYMEDYYLTLQLFTRENCDWHSLLMTNHIGDYTYLLDASGGGTLSLLSDEARTALKVSAEYGRCEAAIQEMRQRLGRSRAPGTPGRT